MWKKSTLPEGEKISIGAAQNFSHNGGYQLLAYLYASSGNSSRALQCLDSLKKFNQDYDKLFINSKHVSACFVLYGHTEPFKEFVQAYSKKIGVPAYVYVREIVNGTGITFVDYIIKFIKRGNINDILRYLDLATRKRLFNYTRELVQEELKTSDEINYNLALLYKLEGALTDKIGYQRGLPDEENVDSLFMVALSYYEKVSTSFLDERIQVTVQTSFVNTEKRTLPRKHLFIFPDQLKTAESYYQPNWFRFYGEAFFSFMRKNNLFSKFYKSQEDYQLLTQWLIAYFEQYGQQGNRAALLYPELGMSTFLTIDSLITQSKFDVDDAWIKLTLIRNYFKTGDTLNAYHQVEALKFKEFERFGGGDRDAFHNAKMKVAGELAIRGKRQESLKIIAHFLNPKNRVMGYAKLATVCQRNEVYNEARVYLDSANAELSRLKNLDGGFRTPLVEVLTLQNEKESEQKALEYIGSMSGSRSRWGARQPAVPTGAACWSGSKC